MNFYYPEHILVPVKKNENKSKMTRNLVQEEREKYIQKWIPELFSKKYNSVLYVGANKKRQHFLDVFEQSGYSKIIILEIFFENVKYLKNKFSNSTIHSILHGDVRNVEKLNLDKFDVIFFWHGIDLLPENDVKTTINKLENMGNNLIVLGMPFGKYPKNDTVYDNNPNEDHVSPIHPSFLEDLGYKTKTLGSPDKIGSSITAWKFLD